MRVRRWTADKRPYREGHPNLWACSLELECGHGHVLIGLDLPWREVDRLNELIAKGPVRLSQIFGATEP